VPVCTSDAGRVAPIRFAGAIDIAYREALDADYGYSGLICKNPLHPSWRVWTPGSVYDLPHLAEFVDLSQYRDRRRHLDDYGLGRNCTLFERLRRWAYKAIRQHWRPDGARHWHGAVLDHAECYNDFSTPLPYGEVKATARSIARWTWRHFTPASWRKVQADRGRLGAVASAASKRAATEARILEAIGQLHQQGDRVSQAAVARLAGIHQSTIAKHYRHLLPKL